MVELGHKRRTDHYDMKCKDKGDISISSVPPLKTGHHQALFVTNEDGSS